MKKILLLLCCLLALPLRVSALELERKVTFDIPAQSLATALIRFAQQTDLQVVTAGQKVEGIDSKGVAGEHSVAEALTALLEGTGFNFQVVGEGTVTIVAHRSEQADVLPGDQRSPDPAAATSSADSTLEEVVVTGSHIRGNAPVGSELIVISREQIDRSGFATVTDLLARLPQNAGGSAQDQDFTYFSDRAASNNRSRGTAANLRGLGGGETLVLLNGRRLTPSGAGSFVDLSMIPLSAVERVEILLDGASSIYGSDAVGGAINFILRKDYDGAETRARYGSVTQGSLRETRLGQTFGKSWDSGNVLLTYEFYDRDNLRTAERDFASDAEDPNDLLSAAKRHSVILSGSQAFGKRVNAFGEVLYSQRDSDWTTTLDGLTIQSAPRARQYDISGGTSVQMARGWVAEVSALYGRNDERSYDLYPDHSFNTQSRFDLASLDAKVDGPVFELPAGAAKLALGVAARREALEQSAVQKRLDRDLYAAFGELLIPLISQANSRAGVRALELSVSVRAEHYSDFGSTTDPKYGMLWMPIEGLNLRASYGTSFKAPLLVDFATQDNNAILFNIDDPGAADGTTLALFLNGGNPDLKAETATTWSLGADFTPQSAPQLQFEASYFDIRFTNRISTLPISVLTSVVDAAQTFSPAVRLHPEPADVEALLAISPVFLDFYGQPYTLDDIEAIVDSRVVNLAVANVRGIDFGANYRLQSELGALDLNLGGTYLLDFQQGASRAAPLQEFVSTSFSPVDLQLRASGTLSRGGLSATLAASYVDGYRDILVVPTGRVASWTTFDISLIYRTPANQASRLLSDLTVLLSAQNILDKDPPFATSPPLRTPAGYDPANASGLGRFVALEIRKAW